MKVLRLRKQHELLHAAFQDVGGWEIPSSYGDIGDEVTAVRTAVGIADLQCRGKISVTGEDRVRWLQSLISNDILSLQPGQGLYSSLLTHKGKMLTYFRVYLQPEAVLIEDVGEIGETTYQQLRKFLLYGTKAKMAALQESWGHLLLSGPRAADLVRQVFGIELRKAPPLTLTPVSFAGQTILLLTTEETGECDIEVLAPGETIETAWQQLWAHGTAMGLRAFGAEAREVLRLEAGLPRAGRDLTEEIVPPEANLEGKAFSLTKGCYPGQEVVARMDTYGSVRRRLVGLVLKDRVVPPAGARLLSDERDVGWVSSAVHSPRLGYPVALGFPLRDFTTPGTTLTVAWDETRIAAVVQSLPFYTAA